MVFVITQQTFDEAVQQNINDLELTLEEALEETVNQFKAQGVDLSNIVKTPGSFENVSNILQKLAKLKISENDNQDSIEELTALKNECEKGVEYRVSAGQKGAYSIVLGILSTENKNLKLAALNTMVSLMTKQPDLLDDAGAAFILSTLNENGDGDVQKLVLKWAKESCIMHEANRQKLMDLKIVNKVGVFLKRKNIELLKEVLGLLRALILDDDVRVEFGRAHEHARIIAGECLISIIHILNDSKNDELLVTDLLLTISSLLVRAEYCKMVAELGGLEFVHDIMANFLLNEKIARQCFKVIKALAGHDECKLQIIQKGLAPVISNSLNTHKTSVLTATAGLGCVSALALRCPENSKALFEAAIPDAIIDIMKTHPNETAVQRTASWAIRNMVSRSRYQNSHFIELGVEDLLQANLTLFKDFEFDTKAALRDLECNVDLREDWTGKGGKLTSGVIKTD